MAVGGPDKFEIGSMGLFDVGCREVLRWEEAFQVTHLELPVRDRQVGLRLHVVYLSWLRGDQRYLLHVNIVQIYAAQPAIKEYLSTFLERICAPLVCLITNNYQMNAVSLLRRCRRVILPNRCAVRLRIQGQINQKTSDKVGFELEKVKSNPPQAILVTINSSGGSLTQANHIAFTLQHFSKETNVPVLCFAEDQCLSSAHVVLAAGKGSYANSMSMMGNIGFSWGKLWMHKLAENYGVQPQMIHAGQNKVKFNIFEEIKPENEKWMRDRLTLMEAELKSKIYSLRKEQFQSKKLNQTDISEQLLRGGLIDPEEALQYGLIDGIKNMDDVLGQFKNPKLVDQMKKSSLEKYKISL